MHLSTDKECLHTEYIKRRRNSNHKRKRLSICQLEETIDYRQLERQLKETVDLSIGRNYRYVNRKRLSICQLEGTIGYRQSVETTDKSVGRDTIDILIRRQSYLISNK